jgi:hypothetical protein
MCSMSVLLAIILFHCVRLTYCSIGNDEFREIEDKTSLLTFPAEQTKMIFAVQFPIYTIRYDQRRSQSLAQRQTLFFPVS